MNRRFNVPLIAALVVAMVSRCLAWNSTGHEIVAQIAYDTLSADAKAKIVAVLKNHPRVKEDLLADIAPGEDPDRALFIRAATWPDMIRAPMNPMSHTENHPIWHYVDYPFELDGVQGPVPDEHWNGHDDPTNLLQAMQKVTQELNGPATPTARKAIDLCWVEHLCGDIHQPLHAVSLFSKQYPDGDKGGNLVITHNPGDIIVGPETLVLHTLWDDIEGLSLDEKFIRQNADRIEAAYPADSLKDQTAITDVAAWAKESLELAKTKVYLDGKLPHATREEVNMNPDLAPALPDGYEKDAKAVADQRIALAGYRLAAKLEEIAKGW
jgi:S1/P1 Nuclease